MRDGKTIHFSVGAIIENDGKVLLLDRANPPYGLAGPAGHVDLGETPEQAIRREVAEETGLEASKVELLKEEFVPWNECKEGIKGHHWYVYRTETTGKLKPAEREAKSLGWYDIKMAKGLEPVWEHFFKELGLL